MASPTQKILPLILIPGLVSVFVLALAFTPVIDSMDKAVYDLLLGVKAVPPPSPQVMFLDIDDEAIDRLGVFPWPRNIVADGLLTLRELGLGQVVFDIEYIDASPPGVNKYYLDKGLKRDFDKTFDGLTTNVADLFLALKDKQIPLKSADEYANQLIEEARQNGQALYKSSRQVAVDNDLYLGQALAYFGKSYITLNRQETLSDRSDRHKELLSLVEKRFSRNFQGAESRGNPFVDFFIPVQELTSRAYSAGLTNVEIDSDGKRRRIRLFENVNGHWYPQLAFAPTLDLLRPASVEVANDHVTLHSATMLDGKILTIRIPLDSKGNMLIHWQKEEFIKSFVHRSFSQIINLRTQEESVVDRLTTLAQSDVWRAWDGPNEAQELVDLHSDWERIRDDALASGEEPQFQQSIEAKEAWISLVNDFVASTTLSDLSEVLGLLTSQASQEEKNLYQTLKDRFDENQKLLATDWKSFSSNRADLKEGLQGRMAFVGWVATGTTDFGTNPFQNKYALVGTHANVVNTILSNTFITELPAWWSLVIAPIFAFGLVFLLRNLEPLAQNLAGVGIVAAFIVAGLIVFVVSGVFVALIAPVLAMFLSFVAFSLVRFLGAEQEKSFLRKAFSTYLSGDVINEIVTDPGKLKLGGDNKWMTAMFTDVKGFSTISEKLTAPQLVHLLNEYLSGMSDIVLNEKGTIDKYEGDAIIAFFGAPLDLPDHAGRACLAAIRMRQLEARLNPGFLERQMTPVPLMTRIGINTGEMVVGNMGTERKMNYTIMGNAVNLAARLEGVNKQYGTWILTTEFTAKEAGESFLFRRLDRVRVVGINTPVRLMNLLGLRNEEGASGEALVEEFHAALDIFETRDWTKAAQAFQALATRYPDDGPCQLYAKRCQAIVAGTLKVADDGVFNLTEK